jgi:hypothetical protein
MVCWWVLVHCSHIMFLATPQSAIFSVLSLRVANSLPYSKGKQQSDFFNKFCHLKNPKVEFLMGF